MSIRDRLLEAIDGSSFSDRELSMLATGSTDTVRNIRRGSTPRLDTVEALCRVLKLRLEIDSLHVGAQGRRETPRPSPDLELHMQALVRALAAAGGDPIPPEMRDVVRPQVPWREMGEQAKKTLAKIAKMREIVAIPFLPDMQLAAGAGELAETESVEMAIAMSRGRLASWASPERLRCARVTGNSMLPEVRDGDLAAIDIGRTEPLEGQMFAVRTDKGLVLKRMRRIGDRWHLTSDNPAYAPRPVAEDDRIVGQVAWAGPPAAQER